MFYARGNPIASAFMFLIAPWPLALILWVMGLAIRDWRRENAKRDHSKQEEVKLTTVRLDDNAVPLLGSRILVLIEAPAASSNPFGICR